jgi:fibronectin type 3 domain-containing protein
MYGGGEYGVGEYGITAPKPPSNVQITDSSTEGEITLDWDAVSLASGYKIYRAETSGSSVADYTEVGDTSSPPYTDTSVEDGEKYYYRVSSYI